jgi:hypothetical protein
MPTIQTKPTIVLRLTQHKSGKWRLTIKASAITATRTRCTLTTDGEMKLKTLPSGLFAAGSVIETRILPRLAEMLSKNEGSADAGSSAPYGFCPTCGAPGAIRERRPNGNDRCSAGHTYPSRNSVEKVGP